MLTPMDVEGKIEFFENPYKLICGTIKYSRSGIWGPRLRNTRFWSGFAVNWRFSVKS
jgi:hypothetical protein